jgi:hypothetical protein
MEEGAVGGVSDIMTGKTEEPTVHKAHEDQLLF